MKKLILALALCLTACTTRSIHPPLGVEQTVTTGSPIVEWRISSGMFPLRQHTVKQLIYLGSVTGDVLRVAFKDEITKGQGAYGVLFRDRSYANELTYDTSKGKEITFQDIELEVKDFDSSRIRYVVTKVPAEYQKK